MADTPLEDLRYCISQIDEQLDWIGNATANGYLMPGQSREVLEASLIAANNIKRGLAAIGSLMAGPELPLIHRSNVQ